jgi:rubrerythrin
MSTTSNPTAVGPILSVAELFVHALELEHESAERYLELAESMDIHHNTEVARLFRQLAAMSEAHAREVQRRSAGMQLPHIPPWDFKWHCPGSPEGHCDHSRIGYLMTATEALEVAQLNETRSRDFYAWVAAESPDAEVRALAAAMAEEECGHVEIIDTWRRDHAEHCVAPPEDLDPPNILG